MLYIGRHLPQSYGVSVNVAATRRSINGEVNILENLTQHLMQNPGLLHPELKPLEDVCLIGHGHGGMVALAAAAKLDAQRVLLFNPWLEEEDITQISDRIHKFKGTICLVDTINDCTKGKIDNTRLNYLINDSSTNYRLTPRFYDHRIDPELIFNAIDWFLGKKYFEPDVTQRMYLEKLPVGKKEVCIEITPHKRGRILIYSSGCEGTLEGFQDKHIKISRHMQEQGVSVIRFSPPNRMQDGYEHKGWDYDFDFHREILRETVNYALEHSRAISSSDTPEIYLASCGLGAWAAGFAANEFRTSCRMKGALMINPTRVNDVGRAQREVRRYQEKLYVVCSQGDPNIPDNTTMIRVFPQSKLNYKLVPNVDHDFSGIEGGMRYSAAFDWMISDGTRPYEDFPGIRLYDSGGRPESCVMRLR